MELNNISFSYEGREPFLIEDLTLKLEPGMFLTVLGENGSAKSTLIKLMLGLNKPNKGTINCNFNKVGYVPQKKEIFNMKFPITVKEMIDIHIRTSGNKSHGHDHYLKKVEMENEAGTLFGDLSGGQQQRVLIARAISSDPDLLILDEPLTGIDSKSQTLLRNLLHSMNVDGLTIVSIEHDIAYALHNSSHILTMKEGKGTLYTVKEFLKRISHEEMDNYLYHKEVHSHA
ncbi:MAG: metal ABC transporter ATP-binding protein [Clostridiaceae bacterium]